MEIKAGRILSERYRLIRPIGHGSQASVWVAEHLALQTNVAVKLIDPELAKKEAARERFRREATAAAQLRSAHVVQILDHGIHGDQPFIVMELLDGEDLFERLAHRGRLSLRETSRIATQVGRALSRAHQAGIVHRDLKPENVFLVPNEDDEMVKVLDFGVAKVATIDDKEAIRQTGVGTLIGTPHYMSPEQAKGIVEVDYRADLWALGVIAYQCVTGELPFDSQGVGDLLIKISTGEIPVPSKVFPSVPSLFDAWFAKACDRDVNKRFQSARELALALATVVAGVTEVPRAATVRPPGKAAPSTRSPPRMGTPAVQVPRPALMPQPAEEALEASDLEEVGPEESGRDMFDSTDIDFDFDNEPEPNLRFSHVEFPLLVRAGSSPQLPSPAAATATAPSAPPPVQAIPPPPRAPSASAPAATERVSGAPAPPVSSPRATPLPQRIAPVIDVPAVAAPRSPVPPRPQPPRPQPPTPAKAAPAPSNIARSTVSGLARPGLISADAEPEFDGSKRKRMVRILVAALVLGALGITITVVRSQFRAMGPAAGPAETAAVAPSALPGTPPTVEPPHTTTPPPMVSAIDPGKVSRPIRPTPSVNKTKAPVKGTKKLPDGVIEIPDSPDVPPAP